MARQEILTKWIGEHEEAAVYFPERVTPETRVIITIHGNWATRMRNHNYGMYFAERGYIVIAPTHRHHYLGNQHNRQLGKTSVYDYVLDTCILGFSLDCGFLLPGYTPRHGPIIIGHSLGGLIAQAIAENAPRISATVLLCSAPPAGTSLHTDKDYKKKITRYALPILAGKPYLPDFKAMREYIYNNMPKEMHQKLYDGAVYESGASSREVIAGSGSGLPKMLARLLSLPIAVDESKITCPMLVVGCKKDKIIPPAVADDLYAKYSARPAGETHKIIFDEFAHWPQTEPGWERSARAIHSWLAYTASKRPSL